MSRDWIVVGDTTSHGGRVESGDPIMKAGGKAVARIGDPVSCPRCKGTFPIETGASRHFLGSNRQPFARHGDVTACGAVLIAGQQIRGTWRGDGSSVLHAPPQSREDYDEHFILVDDRTGVPIKERSVHLVTGSGNKLTSTTDELGATPRIDSTSSEPVKLHVADQDEVEL